jgi:hypothetical protein
MLIGFINDTISTLSSMNLPKPIPVGNADAGAYFNTEVLESVAYGVRYSVTLNFDTAAH